MHPAFIKAIAADHVRDMQAEAASRSQIRRARKARRRSAATAHGPGSGHGPQLRSA